MKNHFLSLEDASRLISAGTPTVVAGAEELLVQLPHGPWIGATTPYFIGPDGGTQSTTQLFCTTIDEASDVITVALSPDELDRVAADGFRGGFSYGLLPAFSEAHRRFALGAASFPGIYDRPLMGWVAGVDLADVGAVAPKVVNGVTGELLDDALVVLHVKLPDGFAPNIDIVNLFEQGAGGSIEFAETGWSATTCTVDGTEVELASWLSENHVDTQLPLVADYSGAMINVSFQSTDDDGTVHFYAPVIAGEQYRIARPIDDYSTAYAEGVGATTAAAGDALSCNCILNYLYAGLEGQRTSEFVGPVTFGEIAYILLNQTLVHLDTVPTA